MFDFLKTLFNPQPPSSTTAKERLRLVLLSDHLSLSPETIVALKADLLAVISKYVEIDSSHADVTFEHRENEVAMLANIPITGVRERKRPLAVDVAAASPAQANAVPHATQATRADAVVDPAPASTTFASTALGTTSLAHEIEPTATSEPATSVVTATTVVAATPAATQANATTGTTRRRRRKKAQNPAPRPA